MQHRVAVGRDTVVRQTIIRGHELRTGVITHQQTTLCALGATQ